MTGTGFKGRWKALPDSVGNDSRLKAIHKQIYLVLARRAQDNAARECWPSHKTTAADIGVTRRTIHDNLPLLIEIGFIEIVGQTTLQGGGLGSLIYRINEFPKIPDPKLVGVQKRQFHTEWKETHRQRCGARAGVKNSPHEKLHTRKSAGAKKIGCEDFVVTDVKNSANGCEAGVQILHTNRDTDSYSENPESVDRGFGGKEKPPCSANELTPASETALQEEWQIEMPDIRPKRPRSKYTSLDTLVLDDDILADCRKYGPDLKPRAELARFKLLITNGGPKYQDYRAGFRIFLRRGQRSFVQRMTPNVRRPRYG